ncbi:MAG: pyridoxal 5'-phosphate synthase glutaminase subunit PdxT [Anaerolineaceae bacterium]|nr:MAG: pyridoxal 5'-phosphate synthase glutaminase subunit PdxT [Anaerolineaceae bacterium]
MIKVGVLALQGDFAEHIATLRSIGVETVEVRLPEQLVDLEGLIIPGGESTTIGKLATSYHLIEPLRRFSQDRPVWGTCAGAIFLSNDARRGQPLLNVMDITVERNAFGRQVDSFETELSIPVLENPDRPYRAIFIRAPIIESVGEGVEIIARLPIDSEDEDRIVAARQGHLLATSFHPELTGDDRFHRYFLGLAKG